jgi:hypothetical protein
MAQMVASAQMSTSPHEQRSRTQERRTPEAAYHERLVELVRRHARQGWDHLLMASQGAHPLELAGAARRARVALPAHSGQTGGPVDQEIPELHQLEHEWYFDFDTSSRLAEELLAASASVLLGCPTVARDAARIGRRRPLIDHSVGLISRLRRWGAPAAVIADLRRPAQRALQGEFAVVLLDPPWHLQDTLLWLAHAARLCRAGGTIAMPLFGALTKPSAADERASILRAAEAIGRISVQDAVLRYATPTFEAEACVAGGIPAPGNWRRADLLMITAAARRSIAGDEASARPAPERWRTWVLGQRVVKLRIDAGAWAVTDARGMALQPVPGAVNWVLPSVRRQHPERARIGLWTSRQRVATVGDPAAVARWLDRIAGIEAGAAREGPPGELLALLS